MPRALTSWRLAVLVTAGLAALTFVAGTAYERRQLAGGTRAAATRAEQAVRDLIAARASLLSRSVANVADSAPAKRLLADGATGTATLFDLLAQARAQALDADLALTIGNDEGRPLAWVGRPSSEPLGRADGRGGFSLLPEPLGLRLAFVAPVGHGGDDRALGIVRGECLLARAEIAEDPSASRYRVIAAGLPVELRPPSAAGASREGEHVFIVNAGGAPLVEARLDLSTIPAARARARTLIVRTSAGVLAVGALVVALLLGSHLPYCRSVQAYATRATAVAAVLFGARALGAVALDVPTWLPIVVSGAATPMAPASLLLDAGLTICLVAILADAVYLARLSLRRLRAAPTRTRGHSVLAAVTQIAAGAIAGLILAWFGTMLGGFVGRSNVDVLHLSLHPLEADRLALLAALILGSAACVWALVTLYSAALLPWRPTRSRMTTAVQILLAWVAPGILVIAAAAQDRTVAVIPLVTMLIMSAAAAWMIAGGLGRFRHGSHARRLALLVFSLVVPALLLYPSLAYYAEREQERLVESVYGPQAIGHLQDLQARLADALHAVDAATGLPETVAGLSQVSETPDTAAAFSLWRRTALGDQRLTSAVELYAPDGRLVSRFALNFPEYAPLTQRWQASFCEWEVFGEALSFGAEERRLLHAERALCDRNGQAQGAIVIHVIPDYDALPFVSARTPYFALFRNAGGGMPEGRQGRDVELIIYGWGRTPLYTSTGRAWPLDDGLFGRIYRSREAFWTDLVERSERYRAYVANDRFGIYLLTFPRLDTFAHLVHLAEIGSLATLLAVLILVVVALARTLDASAERPGRLLLREVRTSFYRKLFLAFVASAVVPVLILALAVRAYVAGRLRADVEAEASRTVSVARRVIEESIALQRGGQEAFTRLDDDALVWIAKVIDQDVNLFDGPELVATSERDLFASGLLSTRVSESVYRAVVIDRLPTFVGEERVGDFRFLMAAAPVRTTGRDSIIAVPMALRQQEIEREIDELDQSIQLGTVVFILLGAAIGFWMAERIGDPVQRLTRASRRIAMGDLDARVLVRTSDELQRLVESFNTMAVELQRQRVQLERTNRLEAWADMARQVAHDIKNPLTPIQLAAEHLLRVNRDRGEPLSPVLQECIDSILAQVRILRQIASEFSSFATAPEVRLAPTDVGDLLREVLSVYGSGIAGRVAIELEVPADMSPVVIDRTLVGRAVTNVVENGLHAMPSGGTLSVVVTDEPDGVEIAIRDTGVGMDDAAVDRVFEPYFSTKAIGTGLGLTIAKRNVELHGGTIRVASRRGIGTTVTVRLPRKADAEPPLQSSPT